MASKIVHITDFHLYGDAQLAAWGAWGDLRPFSTLEVVLVHAKSQARTVFFALSGRRCAVYNVFLTFA